MGPIPYGYRLARKILVDHPEEQVVIRAIMELHRAGKSLREIMAELATAGIPSPHGMPRWSASAINGVIRRG